MVRTSLNIRRQSRRYRFDQERVPK
ncbi:hypothetical protein VTL71DRAFT_10797 [Oculimacula yallundae]|uniref:Ribosomal protein S18 n=1 Tax=Oculimacula yallundae TaxID=86028 RepID=A0ABR4CV54_9HELO